MHGSPELFAAVNSFAGQFQLLPSEACCRKLNRLVDLYISGATAKIAFEAPSYGGFVRLRIAVEQTLDRQHHAGRAEAALDAAAPDHGLLDRVQLTRLADALDGRDLPVLGLPGSVLLDLAGDLIKDITRLYNRTRQANITKEISELIAGSEAFHPPHRGADA